MKSKPPPSGDGAWNVVMKHDLQYFSSLATSATTTYALASKLIEIALSSVYVEVKMGATTATSSTVLVVAFQWSTTNTTYA